MASIYDIAQIASGDALGRASEAGREASTLHAQYKHQKEIIDEINKAIKDAEKKSQKGKFGTGVGGSIIGGILGMGLAGLTGGAAAPWITKALMAGGAGLGSGVTEKLRQDILDPTKKLKKLKKKLGGRKQAQDVGRTTEAFEAGLKDMLMGDVTSNILSSLIMPGVMEKGKEALGIEAIGTGTYIGGETLAEDIVNVGQKEIGETVASDIDVFPKLVEDMKAQGYELRDQGGFFKKGTTTGGDLIETVSDFEGPVEYFTDRVSTESDYIPIDVGGPNIIQEGTSEQSFYNRDFPGYSIETQAPTKDVMKLFGMKSKVADDYKAGQGGDMLSALTGGLLDPSKMPWVGEALQNPWVANLGRALGPSMYQELFKPKPMFDPYAQPQFRNPFRGGY